MGKILRMSKLTTLSELIIVVIVIGAIIVGLNYYSPGLMVGESKTLDGLNIDKGEVNNVSDVAKN